MATTTPPIVDFACHFYPPAVVDEDRKTGAFWTHLGSVPYDRETLLARLTAAGVDRAVLSTPSYMGHADAAQTAAANDALGEVVAASDRLLALAGLPTAAGGDAAAAEFERCLDRGFNGAAIETESDGIGVTDPRLEPVLEVADRTGAPVFVHPKLHDSLAPDALDDTYYYNGIYGREAALAIALSNVVYEEVVDRYPNAPLVFHHLGGNIATMLGRVKVHADRPRWPFKEQLLPHGEFMHGLRQVYIDTSGHFDNRHALTAALDTFPPAHVLFGTDTPFEARSAEDIDRYVQAVREVASGTDATLILGANALDLLVNVP